MTFDHLVSLVSACTSLAGLIFVAVQLRDSNRQRESEAIVKLYDVNRQLIALAFSHRSFLKILEDQPVADPLLEKRYLQLWLNQLSLIHTFLKHAVVENELKDELHRNLVDFLSMENMRKHWKHYGSFYPDSFQKRVNQILSKQSEPPAKAAHHEKTRGTHDAKT
jgi:hypothetical protein